MKIERKSQGMIRAIESNIEGAYDNLNHKILMNCLKKKVLDKKFLKLIQNAIKQNIVFKKRKIKGDIANKIRLQKPKIATEETV